MPFTKLLPTSIDLAQNFAFTGTVSGAGGGKIGQVVHTKSTTYKTYNSSSFFTCMSVTITPSATNSVILLLCSPHLSKDTNNTHVHDKIVRVVGGSDVASQPLSDHTGKTNTTTNLDIGYSTCQWYDSPSTTSAVTYDYRFASYSNNQAVVFNNYHAGGSYSSHFTAMEILA